MKSLHVSRAEEIWLSAFKGLLAERFEDVVDDVIVFGSKARGDSSPESDLDLLIIIRAGDRGLKERIADAAYDLAMGTEVVPSIQVYTASEWDARRRRRSVFHDAVEREGISVR